MSRKTIARSGLTVGKLRDLIRNLPDNMDVRMSPSMVDELHVSVVETYPDTRGGTLMLSDVPGSASGSAVLFDRYEPREE